MAEIIVLLPAPLGPYKTVIPFDLKLCSKLNVMFPTFPSTRAYKSVTTLSPLL